MALLIKSINQEGAIMSNQFSFTTIQSELDYPKIILIVKDEATEHTYEMEISLGWHGVTIRLPNQYPDPSEDKSIVIDVFEDMFSAYIYDNAEEIEPERIIIIPKLNHTNETNRIVGHEIVQNTPYGEIQADKENPIPERMTRVELLRYVKELKNRVDGLEMSDTLIQELQTEQE